MTQYARLLFYDVGCPADLYDTVCSNKHKFVVEHTDHINPQAHPRDIRVACRPAGVLGHDQQSAAGTQSSYVVYNYVDGKWVCLTGFKPYSESVIVTDGARAWPQ